MRTAAVTSGQQRGEIMALNWHMTRAARVAHFVHNTRVDAPQRASSSVTGVAASETAFVAIHPPA
jgi:hypothetical protein